MKEKGSPSSKKTTPYNMKESGPNQKTLKKDTSGMIMRSHRDSSEIFRRERKPRGEKKSIDKLAPEQILN